MRTHYKPAKSAKPSTSPTLLSHNVNRDFVDAADIVDAIDAMPLRASGTAKSVGERCVNEL